MTTNGDKVNYDRRDFLTKEIEYSPYNEMQSSDFSITADPYYGTPYSNVLCGQKTITYPTIVTARAYESYTFYDYNYIEWSVKALTPLSVIVAILCLPWSTVWAILSGILAFVSGTWLVIEAVWGDKTETQQRWDRYCIILQDGNTWANEYKTVDSQISRINGPKYGPHILQTWQTSHYYDILDYAIDNYLSLLW